MPFTPVWFMIISPIVWLFLMPSLLLLIGVVLFFLSRVFKIDNPTAFIKKSFFKVFLSTFLSYFAATIVLFLSQGAFNDWWYEFLTTPVAFNPFDNIYALLFTLLGIAAGGFCAFLLNFKFALSRVVSDEKLRRMIALCTAVLTVPLLYLTPSRLLFDEPGTQLYNFTNHIVWTVNDTVQITDADGSESVISLPLSTDESVEDSEAKAIATDFWTLVDAINHAEFTRDPIAGEPLCTLDFHSVHQAGRPVTVDVQTTADDRLVFICDAGIFFAQSEEQAAVLAVLAK